ncbi:hypothetical protein CHU95_04335 [Niveispirillum lacus]|uniref:O-antigen polymerase n=1 Tax=Niveispirillum lacus TaxID=1981099 RepID=A0A255Z4P7_9PROT|nr:hypothetical protein [Niveispirillum lacus]OYQ36458.1 hypothetical protein CHU95_04335 [Niveispirillum lacus]
MRVDRLTEGRLWALALSVLAYGAASAPAPPGIRPQELLVFAGIAVFVGITGPWRFFAGLEVARAPAPLAAGSAILVWLLWQGFVRGLWNGWGLTDMMRDIVPMLFLALPLLLAPILGRLTTDQADRLADAAAAAGVLFTVRWWYDTGMALSAVGTSALGEGRYYLLNSALVPFASVWLGLRSMRWLLASQPTAAERVQALLAAAGCLCCLLAQAATLHRAGLLLSLLALGLGMGRWLWRRPALFLTLFLLASASLIGVGARVAGVAALLADKTESVGLNNRVDELLAVLEQVGRHPVSFLIGDGWGALVPNPAVGWWRVSYTHSAASYFLLKLGALGLALILCLAGLLAGVLARAARDMPMLLLAASPSLLLGAFLHTSFKYLCFSLLLSLVTGRAYMSLYRR